MRAILAFALTASSFTAGAVDSAAVAVLGEPQCGDQSMAVVRPLFAKSDGKWIPLNTKARADVFLPKTIRWTVSLNGKTIGALSSTDVGIVPEPAWTYPRDYWHLPMAGEAIPVFPNSAQSFAGWCEAPKHRPLVLSTTTHPSDPEHWKKAPSSIKRTALLVPAFRNSLKRAPLCFKPEKPTSYTLRAKDLRIVTRIVAQDGRELVELRLAKDIFECASELGYPLGNRWFVIGSTTRFLGADLELIDIADYDKDGRSEYIFWYSGYNRDGYSIFSADFEQRTDFLWNYH